MYLQVNHEPQMWRHKPSGVVWRNHSLYCLGKVASALFCYWRPVVLHGKTLRDRIWMFYRDWLEKTWATTIIIELSWTIHSSWFEGRCRKWYCKVETNCIIMAKRGDQYLKQPLPLGLSPSPSAVKHHNTVVKSSRWHFLWNPLLI